jgi:hypothetical protein
MDLEDFVSDELWSLAETPEGEGLTHEVEFWCVGYKENDIEEDEIIARLAGMNMIEEEWYSEAYRFCAGVK